MRAVDKFQSRADRVNSLLCVGLDTDLQRIPAHFRKDEFPQFAFNRFIIDQTHPFTAAYKPNIAFYEAQGEQGLRELRLTMEYLRQNHPDILTICDAKRADIGSTNDAYAAAIFDQLGFDAVTLHPYLGHEALQPFLARADKGCIILCRTSNPGAGEFQDMQVDGKPLWLVVAEKVCQDWNANDNCMLVVGATYPEEMRRIRLAAGGMTFLVPGVGAQGGDVQATIRAGLNSAGKGIIINASRSILFDASPADAAKALRGEINCYR